MIHNPFSAIFRALPTIGVFVLMIFTGCDRNKKSDPHAVVPPASQNEIFKKELSDYPAEIHEVITGMEGDFRGLTFGMSKENVEAVERAKFEALEIDSLGGEVQRYGLEFGLESNADIEYHFGSNNALNQVLVTVYCTKEQHRNELFSEYTAYFNEEYGKVKTKKGQSLWEPGSKNVFALTKEGGGAHPNLILAVSPLTPR